MRPVDHIAHGIAAPTYDTPFPRSAQAPTEPEVEGWPFNHRAQQSNQEWVDDNGRKRWNGMANNNDINPVVHAIAAPAADTPFDRPANPP